MVDTAADAETIAMWSHDARLYARSSRDARRLNGSIDVVDIAVKNKSTIRKCTPPPKLKPSAAIEQADDRGELDQRFRPYNVPRRQGRDAAVDNFEVATAGEGREGGADGEFDGLLSNDEQQMLGLLSKDEQKMLMPALMLLMKKKLMVEASKEKTEKPAEAEAAYDKQVHDIDEQIAALRRALGAKSGILRARFSIAHDKKKPSNPTVHNDRRKASKMASRAASLSPKSRRKEEATIVASGRSKRSPKSCRSRSKSADDSAARGLSRSPGWIKSTGSVATSLLGRSSKGRSRQSGKYILCGCIDLSLPEPQLDHTGSADTLVGVYCI